MSGTFVIAMLPRIRSMMCCHSTSGVRLTTMRWRSWQVVHRSATSDCPFPAGRACDTPEICSSGRRCGHAGANCGDCLLASARSTLALWPAATLTGADALHRVLAGRQIARLETALVLADHHEGQVAIGILQFHHRTDDRLAAGIIDHTLYRALVVRRPGGPGDEHGSRRNPERETSRDVPEHHVNSSV